MALNLIPLEGAPDRGRFLREVAQLYEDGATIQNIADKYGVSYTGAHRWLQLAGATFRRRGRQPQAREL